MTPDAFYRLTELDRTNWPEMRDQMLRYGEDAALGEPRRYPGYPTWTLDHVGSRLWPSLDRVLRKRRCARRLSNALPSRRALSRLLFFSHGVHDARQRGPTPSAGGLQGLELYLANLSGGWLPVGLYHYNRADQNLAQLAANAERPNWAAMVPSMSLVEGGALLWLLVGDCARVEKKYGPRGYRFLLLEAGHLMQNLCLLSTSLGLSTVPLGGFFEQEIARALTLPASDLVAYVGILGTPMADES